MYMIYICGGLCVLYIYKKLSIHAYLYIFIYHIYVDMCIYIYIGIKYISIYYVFTIYINIYTPSICICIGTVFECSLIVFGCSFCKVLAGKLCP